MSYATTKEPSKVDNAQDPHQVSAYSTLAADISALVEKSIKELEARDHDLITRTKALAEKERKIQQREQLLAEKERTLENKERGISDREKKLTRDEKSLQEERKRHTDHVKSSLANLQQQKHDNVKETEKHLAQLQQNFAEAVAERDSLRAQLAQQNEHDKNNGADAVQLHAAQEEGTHYYNHHQQYELPEQIDHEEEPQHTQPYFPPLHHHPLPYMPQPFHPAYKYPLPARGYPAYQPPFYPMRGYYPPVFPRHMEPRGEPSGEEENGENQPEWREYNQAPNLEEEQHQERQRVHANYPGPHYPPNFWGADSQ